MQLGYNLGILRPRYQVNERSLKQVVGKGNAAGRLGKISRSFALLRIFDLSQHAEIPLLEAFQKINYTKKKKKTCSSGYSMCVCICVCFIISRTSEGTVCVCVVGLKK
ncbi:hypothetical protein ANTQUA_LOCUS3116 [Anthophora quadrimaculata]